MASLRLDIIPDLRTFKKSIGDVVKQSFGSSVGGKSSGGGSGKSSASLLGTIAKSLGAIAFLSNLKPITDILQIVSAFTVLGFLQIIKLAKLFSEFLTFPFTLAALLIPVIGEKIGALIASGKELWDNAIGAIGAFFTGTWEWLKALPGRIWSFLKALPGQIWGYISGLGEVIWNFLKELPSLIWDYMVELPGKIWELLQTGFTWIKDVATNVWNSIKELPSQIWEFIKELPSLIAKSIKSIGGFVSGLFGGGKQVGDAILRPNGDVIRTDPKDTLVAMKNPGLGGGSGSGGSTTYNFYGVQPQEIVDLVYRQLGQQSVRHTRM